MHGTRLPEGLLESARLPEPVFTPSTKADEGHDENISFSAAAELIGEALAAQVRDVALRALQREADWARERGIIIADTKFELGLADGELVLCDEVLTPDSSPSWPTDMGAGLHPAELRQAAGAGPARRARLGQTPPPPRLGQGGGGPGRRYIEAYERIHHGRPFADWPEAGG